MLRRNKSVYFLTFIGIFAWFTSAKLVNTECQIINNISAPELKYTSYNQGILCKPSHITVKPNSLREIQQVIKFGLRSGYTVKPLGNLHSATDIICTDGIPLSLSKIRHFVYDNSTSLVTVGAGVTLEYLLESLHTFGRTINGIPTYSDITVGGAIATGSHGTNLKNSATLSDDIVSLMVVDGLGSVRKISDRKTLRAFRAHLGLLGVVYEITFKTIPQYKLHIENYPLSDNVLWRAKEILRLARSTDRFQFFWFPTSRQVVMSVGHRVPVNTRGNCQTNFISDVSRILNEVLLKSLENMQENGNHLGFFVMQELVKLSLYQRVSIRKPIFSAKNSNTVCNPAIGFSHRMSANRCMECGWNSRQNMSNVLFEMAAIIPLSELEGAIKTMKNILDEYPTEFPISGIYFRFLTASDGLLTVNSGRDSVAIEWTLVSRSDRSGKPILGLPVYQALFQALIYKHQGRPHWGKNGLVYTQREFVSKLYPENLPTFVNQMEEFDPKGVFLNDFGRRLRFGCTKTSMDSNIKHCGLVDSCICIKDEDCGDGSRANSNFCGSIKGYRVCRERMGKYRYRSGRFMRNIVRSLISIKPNVAK